VREGRTHEAVTLARESNPSTLTDYAERIAPPVTLSYNPLMSEHEHLGSLADEELLQNICKGCTECFAILFHRYFRQVFATAFHILHDRAEAEDLLQEVFLAVFLQQETFDKTRGSVKTWILQFAYFKSLLRRRYLRIRSFYRQEEIAEEHQIRLADMPVRVQGISAREWAHSVQSGVATLTTKQQRTIELVYLEGCTLREAADRQRESLANTRNHYYRGLKVLRAFLEGKAEAEKAKERELRAGEGAYQFES
jgi:RNA polymerase sigma-70 factor (ECF subfamily)